MKKAVENTKEWLEVHNKDLQDQGQHVVSSLQHHEDRGWGKPPCGWIKTNYDASHIEGDRPSGLGWII